jgi:gliding motility-associated-like protein
MKLKGTLFTALASFLLLGNYANAQVLFNNGAQIAITDNAPVIVNGAVENAAGATGILKNKGDFHIEGDFKNTSGVADGFASGLGNYRVKGDWINDATFTADQSKVYLAGNNQLITGSSVTTFYDLIAQNAATVKTQRGVDANVSNTLTLNGNELATEGNKLTIQNADPAAIVLNGTDPFVSSTGAGRLVRNTNSTSSYLFPTGWHGTDATLRIREVAIAPSAATQSSYSVRMARNNNDDFTTTTDGFDINTKSTNVQDVNNKYYHLIGSTEETLVNADLTVFYDPSVDGTFSSLGRWQNVPHWEDLVATSSNASPRLKMTKPSWVPTKDESHALLNPKPFNLDFNFPNAFVPGSNNANPENRYFTIINQGDFVTLDELSVFNRWGEMVFNSKRDGNDKWDGMYQGKLQQQANYTYLAIVRNKQTQKLYPTVTGNLTLIW